MTHQPIIRGRLGRPVLALVVTAVLLVAACDPTSTTTTTTTTSTTTTTLPTQVGDIGWEGPSFQGASGGPSGSKPESKLWYAQGSWWADLWDTTTNDFFIHRLDLATHQWVKTTTRLDDRASSRSDVLWDGTHLFVASHAFAEGSTNTATGYPAELRRFSFTGGAYVLDPGFPVAINDARSESLVIEQDSLGRIWATWMQDARIMVSVSAVGGTSFGTPSPLPVSGALVKDDDLSSIVAFGGNQIGIMWSNQLDAKMYFSRRLDSNPVGAWGTPEVAYEGGSNAADDHINLKSVADQNGRILAAVKTSKTGSATLIHLLDRDPATGTWTSHEFGTGTDAHTRPIVLVDRTHQVAHVFASAGQSGGSIYEKTAPLSNLTFPSGKGTAVLTDADSADINNATSTKQSVDETTGIVVVATNDSTRRYWTHYDALGGTTPPTSTSTTTSSSTTSSTSTSSTTSSTTTTTGVPGTPFTLVATADATVQSSNPTKNAGTSTDLRTRAGDPAYNAYLRFTVTGLTAAPTSAKLRLWITDASKDGGSVRLTSSTWGETTITWANAPAPTGGVLAGLGATTVGQWVEVNVTAGVTGNGSVSFQIATTSTDSGISSSRETARAPQLVLTP